VTPSASVAAVAAPTADEIVPKIQWLMLLRIAMITVLLGSTLLINVSDADLFSDPGTLTILGLIVGTYAATIAYAVVLPRVRNHTGFAYLQLVGDVVTTLVLVLLTGGTESIFVFMFSLVVMNAAILLYRRGALILASVAAAVLCVLYLRSGFGWLGGTLVQPGAASRGLLLAATTNISALFLVALLAGYLSEQLRDAGRKLETASASLEDLRALNQHIITSIQSGVLSYALDGRVLFMNAAAERILGVSAERVVLGPIGALLGELGPPQARARAAGERDAPLRWEQRYVRADGDERVLGMSRSPLMDSAGVHRGDILVFQDLTPLRQMEDQIRRTEKFAAIGKMAAGIAHEIRNPLASISGSIEMLQRAENLNQTDRRLMDIVMREIDRLNGLVTDFLRFARPRVGQLESVRLEPLLHEVVEVFGYLGRESMSKRVDVDLLVGQGLQVQADPQQLKQVFWNLLNNAADALSEGGLVQLEARVVGASGAPDDGVEIRVVDHGPGIAPENIARIFDPFYTTKPRGTGLGLALVHRIIEEHGGHVRVESQLGLGATFIVWLPTPDRAPIRPELSPWDSLH
jgi:two-component system sensor histidine kinase PilS (NtrC family)